MIGRPFPKGKRNRSCPDQIAPGALLRILQESLYVHWSFFSYLPMIPSTSGTTYDHSMDLLCNSGRCSPGWKLSIHQTPWDHSRWISKEDAMDLHTPISVVWGKRSRSSQCSSELVLDLIVQPSIFSAWRALQHPRKTNNMNNMNS